MSETYLSGFQIMAIKMLLGKDGLPAYFADTVIACAYATGQTPREMLARLAESYPIDDETWRTTVAPEIAYAIGDAA